MPEQIWTVWWAWIVLGAVTLAFTVVRNLDLGPIAHYLAATSG